MRITVALALATAIAVGTFAGTSAAGASKRSDHTSKRSDRATARSLVLRTTDLTGNWTSGPPDAADDDANDRATARCLGVTKNPNERRDAHVEGPGLTGPDGSDVQSSGNVFESRAALRASLSLFDRPRLATCLERLLRQSIRKDLPNATIGGFTLGELPVTIPGVQARGFRITVAVNDGETGKAASIVSDEILAWKGRLGSSATVTATDAAPPNDLEAEVATALGQKLLAAG
jgi:hypothetical protein